MKLVSAGQQVRQDFLFDASGSITTGGTAQLLLPQHPSRTIFKFINGSADTLYIDFGCGSGPNYALAVLTGTAVTSITVVNAGFNFTKPPLVRFLGGGRPVATLQSGQPAGANTSFVATAGPGFVSPRHEARATANLVSSAISLNQIGSFTVEDGGVYHATPYVLLIPSDLDPNGVVIPGSPTSFPGSITVAPGGRLEFEGSACPTDAVSVVGASSGDAFTCKFMT